MQAREFVASIPAFHSLSPAEQITAFAWFLHSHDAAERFDNEMIRECFRDAHIQAPDVSVYIPRLAEKKRGVFIKDARGYRLAGAVRTELDARYGKHPTTIAVTKLLADLPAKLPNIEQREFLDEALNCYKVSAFRAAIVMTWNLAYDHVLRWIVADAQRVSEFNAAIMRKYQKRQERIAALTDFEQFKESEVLAVLRTGQSQLGISKNMLDILDEKLKRRNAAAHPSRVSIGEPQANAIIIDLVENVVLLLR
jgi:hypothetical protein